jgi:hypothetical protein
MTSLFTWVKTMFTHKGSGEVSMSKVGVLCMALSISLVTGYCTYKGIDTPRNTALLLFAAALVFLLNRVNSRSFKFKWGDKEVNQEFQNGINTKSDS